jgi:hypothetical protein
VGPVCARAAEERIIPVPDRPTGPVVAAAVLLMGQTTVSEFATALLLYLCAAHRAATAACQAASCENQLRAYY